MRSSTAWRRLPRRATLGVTPFNARCIAHAHGHRNVRWKRRGTPLAKIPKRLVFIELLHSVPLNACKLQVKHAWMKYYPDAIRDDAHRLFEAWGVRVDMRKPGKRTDPEKWPGGGVVRFLMDGGNGKCPGFAHVGAQLTFLLAEHLLKEKNALEADAKAAATAQARPQNQSGAQSRGTVAAAAAINADLFSKPGSKRKGASSLPLQVSSTARTAAAVAVGKATEKEAAAVAKKLQDVETIPLESQERLCTPAQVASIKARYGPLLGQRVITTLLSGETFRLAWKVSKKRLTVPAPQSERDDYSFEWFHAWADWVEAAERVADHDFKSWVPHRLLHKGTKQARDYGDLMSRSTHALEANQSEMGRTLDQVSCRRKTIDVGDEKTQRPYLSQVSLCPILPHHPAPGPRPTPHHPNPIPTPPWSRW